MALGVLILPLPRFEWRAALGYIASGRLLAEPLITHRLPLSRAKEALSMMAKGEESFCKVILVMEGEDEVHG